MLAPRLTDTPFLHPNRRCQKMGKGLNRGRMLAASNVIVEDWNLATLSKIFPAG
jgi:hypothetical protein